ncbi:SH3 domain-binding glutamic acid-rich-like protein 3 [Mercenaria mercenaria]|uniref:SH3 domain-binding glutamic acid-rich-like protein 3 n=1 Tax=Mercenaria mercenaria TaxID=6596 RepID=UPI00234E721C|nr:SH3 domain-binding glutamic acid-rich-like protein 3 [Mercenaria mercenaria]
MVIKLYTTSMTTNREIFNRQNRIKHVFDAKGIDFEEIDLCHNQEGRDQMREKAGIPDLLPPAIFNEDRYCGNFQEFEDAVEDNLLKEFLKLQ